MVTAAKMLEHCRVSPPPNSVPETTLPLTFFDVIWLPMPAIQHVLFYELNTTSTRFIDTLLPKFKHSLSLSLRLFFPLAGNLIQSATSGSPVIRYVEGDSVSLVVAESDADFHGLVSNHRKESVEFHHLLPRLHPPSLLALQATVIPDIGIAIGLSMHHVVADGRSLLHFMKSWSTICRTGDDSLVTPPPSYERSMLENREYRLKRVLLEQMANATAALKHRKSKASPKPRAPVPTVRATFVLSRAYIELLRRRVLGKTTHCSTFVLTCAYAWICLIKARGEEAGGNEKTDTLSLAADCRSRMDPPLPGEYFGNCLGLCIAEVKRSDLVSEYGMVAASKAIGKAVQRLDKDKGLKDAETWIPRSIGLMEQRAVSVSGSPRFGVYNIDFGWGRLKKDEVMSIDATGAFHVGESRDEEGGVEFGLALSEQEMGRFASLFQGGLKACM